MSKYHLVLIFMGDIYLTPLLRVPFSLSIFWSVNLSVATRAENLSLSRMSQQSPLKTGSPHHPHGLPGSEEAEPHNALAPSHTSSLAQLVTGQCVILAVLPTDGPRNGCSHKGLVPAVAVGHGAPLAPKRPS